MKDKNDIEICCENCRWYKGVIDDCPNPLICLKQDEFEPNRNLYEAKIEELKKQLADKTSIQPLTWINDALGCFAYRGDFLISIKVNTANLKYFIGIVAGDTDAELYIEGLSNGYKSLEDAKQAVHKCLEKLIEKLVGGVK